MSQRRVPKLVEEYAGNGGGHEGGGQAPRDPMAGGLAHKDQDRRNNCKLNSKVNRVGRLRK